MVRTKIKKQKKPTGGTGLSPALRKFTKKCQEEVQRIALEGPKKVKKKQRGGDKDVKEEHKKHFFFRRTARSPRMKLKEKAGGEKSKAWGRETLTKKRKEGKGNRERRLPNEREGKRSCRPGHGMV